MGEEAEEGGLKVEEEAVGEALLRWELVAEVGALLLLGPMMEEVALVRLEPMVAEGVWLLLKLVVREEALLHLEAAAEEAVWPRQELAVEEAEAISSNH